MNAAGWYADPTSQLQLRYWDGTNWTEDIRPLPAPNGDPLSSPGDDSPATSDVSYVAPLPNSRTVLSWAILGGGVMIAAGTLFAWLTATTALISVSRDAFQLGANESLTADGPIVLVLGLMTMAIGIASITDSAMPRFSQKYALILGLAAAVYLGIEYRSVHNWVNQVSSSYATASIGTGYWICCIGALITMIAGASILRSPRY